MSNRDYRQGLLTPEIQEQIADAEGLWKAGLRLQGVAPSVTQQPLSSTPSTSEPAPSTTSVALHDTPDSPHSEHGPSARGGGTGGGGGPVANAVTDAAVDIVAQLGEDKGYQNDVANAFGAAFREVGRPPSNQEDFGNWAVEMSAAVAGQLQEQGQLPGTEAEAAKHKAAIISSVVDHFQGVGGQQSMPAEKQHPVPRWGDPVNDPGRG